MMKPAMSLPVISALLVFAAISVCGNPLDRTGNTALRSGVPYYILPAMNGTGGGVFPLNLLLNITQVLCPFDPIMQSIFSSNRGVPVIFTPQNSSLSVIPFSHNVNIHFNSDRWLCPDSKFWRVKCSTYLEADALATGGTFGGSDSWFRIERNGDAFKLVHCPQGSTPCRDVGIKSPILFRFLVLTDKPFAVKFVQAPWEESISEEAIREEGIPEESISKETMLRMFPSY